MTRVASQDAMVADAAVRAGVRIELLESLDHLEAAETLINRTWQNEISEISLGVLRALSTSGNFISGAFADGELVGVCLALFGRSGRSELYSHLAAVSGDRRGHGVGFALKVHQRAWALRLGVETISWTYDPLVSRNAYLNLAKLRARPARYLPNFYGVRTDTINVGIPTDRLIVRWTLADPATELGCRGQTDVPDLAALLADGAEVVLSRDSEDGPVEALDEGGRILLVGVPTDIAALRRSRPAVARAWRSAFERNLRPALHAGARVIGFARQGFYVVDRAPG